MVRVGKYEIVLNRPEGVYYASEVIEGVVHLEMKEEQTCRGVRVRFIGECHTNVKEGDSSEDEYELYFDNIITVFGNEKGSTEHAGQDAYLKPGSHEFPFRYQLPNIALPSSFEFQKQSVRYYIKSYIDIHHGSDKAAKKFFSVVRQVDLNASSHCLKPQQRTCDKEVPNMCCGTGNMNVKLQVPRLGYLPGESILLHGAIENRSRKPIRSTKAILLQQVQCRTKRKRATMYRSLVELEKVKSTSPNLCHWNNDLLRIPACVPSGLEACNLIDVKYILKVLVNHSGTSSDLDVTFDVTLGTEPPKESPEVTAPEMVQLGFDPKSAPPDPVPLPTYPGRTYQDCFFGKVTPMDIRDPDPDSQRFAPRYTYYKFS